MQCDEAPARERTRNARQHALLAGRRAPAASGCRAASGTGIALLEVTDLRSLDRAVVPSSDPTNLVVKNVNGFVKPAGISASTGKAALELCPAVPLAITVASR